MKKLISVFLALTMAASLAVPAAATYQDTEGHWAQAAIDRWSEKGVIQGNADGNFNPDAPMTRAQFAVVLDRLMDYQTAGRNTFADVSVNDWFADAVLKANEAGILNGTTAATASPHAAITRQQAMTLLGRALRVEENASAAVRFSDCGQIASYAVGYIGGMAAKGIVNGSGGKCNPTANVTRAQIMTILNNALADTVSAAGEYGKDAPASLIVSAPGVVLKNMTVSGNLILAEGVAEGDVILDGVTVNGTLVVRGGGANSIHIKGNSVVPHTELARRDGGVRLVAEGAAKVANVAVAGGSSVRVEGSISALTMVGSGISLSVNGAIGTLTVAEGADSANVTLGKGATVSTMVTAADNVSIDGAGKITTLNVSGGTGLNVAKNTTVDTVKNNTGNTITVGDKDVAPGDSGSTGGGSTGGGGGGGDPTPPPVITEKTVTTLAELEAALDDASITKINVTGTIASETLELKTDKALTVTSAGSLSVLDVTAGTSTGSARPTTTVTVNAGGTLALCDSARDKFYPMVGAEGLNVTAGSVTVAGTANGITLTIPQGSAAETKGAYMDGGNNNQNYRVPKADTMLVDGALTIGFNTKVVGRMTVNGTLTVPADKALEIAQYKNDTSTGILLINNGSMVLNGELNNNGTLTAGAVAGGGDIWTAYGSSANINGVQVVGGRNPVFGLAEGTEVHVFLGRVGKGYDLRQIGQDEGTDSLGAKTVTLLNNLTLKSGEQLYVKNCVNLELTDGKSITFAKDNGLLLRPGAKISNVTCSDDSLNNLGKITITDEGVITGDFDVTATGSAVLTGKSATADVETVDALEAALADTSIKKINVTGAIESKTLELKTDKALTVTSDGSLGVLDVTAGTSTGSARPTTTVTVNAGGTLALCDSARDKFYPMVGAEGLKVTAGSVTVAGTANGITLTIPQGSAAETKGAYMDGGNNNQNYRIPKADTMVVNGTLTIGFNTKVVGQMTVNGTLTVPADKALEIAQYKNDTSTGILTINNGSMVLNGELNNNGTLTAGAVAGGGDIWTACGSSANINGVQVVGGEAPVFVLAEGTEVHVILGRDGKGYDLRQIGQSMDNDDLDAITVTLLNNLTLKSGEQLYVKNCVNLELTDGKSITFAKDNGLLLREGAKISNVTCSEEGLKNLGNITITDEGVITGGYMDVTATDKAVLTGKSATAAVIASTVLSAPVVEAPPIEEGGVVEPPVGEAA